MQPNGNVDLVTIDIPFLYDPHVWHIADAQKIAKTTAATILVTSSQRDIYKSYCKYASVCTRYMPVWSPEELDDLYEAEYREGLEETEYRRRVEVFGGVPRIVLGFGDVPIPFDQICDTGEKPLYCGRLALYIRTLLGPIETEKHYTC